MNVFPPIQCVPVTIEFEDGNCKRCNKVLSRFNFDDYCKECGFIVKQEAIEAKKKVHLDILSSLPLEERITKIEEWIYEHELNHPSKEVRFR